MVNLVDNLHYSWHVPPKGTLNGILGAGVAGRGAPLRLGGHQARLEERDGVGDVCYIPGWCSFQLCGFLVLFASRWLRRAVLLQLAVLGLFVLTWSTLF